MELVRKEGLLIDEDEHSWEEAIRVCGKLMLSLGSIEAPYIQSMVDVVHNLGPYIVVAPHVALAHAAAGDYVVKDDLVLTVFKKPVIFNSNNDPIYIMFGLCALKPAGHLMLMRQLSKLLEDEDMYKRAIACNSIDELYTLVNGDAVS